MSVSRIEEWRASACEPRNNDLAYGFLLGLLVPRPPVAETVRTGPLVIEPGARQVTVDGESVHLSNRERGLLGHLALHAGQVRTYDEIITAAWGPEWLDGSYSVAPRGTTCWLPQHLVRINACRLRQRLGTARDLVVTVPAIGLRLDVVEPT